MIESTKTPPASDPEAIGAEASPLDGLPPKPEPRSADGKARGGAKLNAEAKRVEVRNLNLYYGDVPGRPGRQHERSSRTR